MTDVDTLVKTTLEKLGYPVERLIYTGKAETFITYQIVVGRIPIFRTMKAARRNSRTGGYLFTWDYIALMRAQNGIEGSGVLRDHV